MILLSAFVTALCSSFYFNATSKDEQLIKLVNESSKIKKLLGSGKIKSKYAKGLVHEQQRTVSNMIALQTKAKNCKELLLMDKNLISGSYTLYPQKKGLLYYCNVEAGKITDQISMPIKTAKK